MIGESYDCEEPVCPYCKPENWTVSHDRIVNAEHDYDYVVLTFECKCKDCGKTFHERRYYSDTDSPEYFPIEESE